MMQFFLKIGIKVLLSLNKAWAGECPAEDRFWTTAAWLFPGQVKVQQKVSPHWTLQGLQAKIYFFAYFQICELN